MDINISTVQRDIERSMLLAPSRKQELLELLPFLGMEGLIAFSELFRYEPERISTVCSLVIERVAKRGDAHLLRDLDRYVRESVKHLRLSEESSIDVEEAIKLEHFFDEIV